MTNSTADFSGKKVLVTGAAGFIGSHLTEELLRQGAEVTALVRYNSRSDNGWLKAAADHERLTIVSGDIRDPFQVERLVAEAQSIFHLAALIGIPFSYAAPQSYIETNVTGTLNILEAARRHKTARVILTSTSEVYGTAITVPIDEQHPLQAQSPYSASKIAADMLGKAYSCSFNLPVTIVRPFNTYGPRQSLRAVIPAIIMQALQSKTIKLGDLRPVRDFNFVTDTARGFIAAALHGKTDASIYNLASGTAYSIGETAAMIAQHLQMDFAICQEEMRIRPAGSEVMRLLGDAGKATQELGWKPQVNLLQGLAQTIAWLKSNQHEYGQTPGYHS